ncbi:hypothetical protein V5O48_019611, partial [Marasmius crinis-equi]
RQFLFGDWIAPALEAYVDVSVTPFLKNIKAEDVERIGCDALHLIARTREANMRRRGELAVVVPPTGIAETDLANLSCSVDLHRKCRDAWNAGWRNEVAPMLVRGSNPMPFRDITRYIQNQIDNAIPGQPNTHSAYCRMNRGCLDSAVHALRWGPEVDEYGWVAMLKKATEELKGL